jgi:hypothetical protein
VNSITVDDSPMADAQTEGLADLQRQFDKLAVWVTINRADIDALQVRTADVSDRTHATEAQADRDRLRIEALEDRADDERQLIAELRAEGLLSRQQAEQLQEALRSSRKIGAAIGIVMANRKVTEDAAFAILKQASMDTNRKLRTIADELVTTGDVSDLPSLPCEQRTPPRDG